MDYYKGYPLIEAESMIKGYRSLPKRKNKKKRIQKKWNKKYGYKTIPIPDDKIYYFDNKFIGHPLTIRKIKKHINKGSV